MKTSPFCTLLLAAACGLPLIAGANGYAETAQTSPPAHPSARWESAIVEFERQDKTSPPPQHATLFVGSSSIRRWDLPTYFGDRPVINRGFGGSELADVVYYAPRIVLPYRPRTIVLYAGDNDIANGKSPEAIRQDFRELVHAVRHPLPNTRIVFIAIKPSLKRWPLIDQIRRANSLIRAEADQDARLGFVDVDGPMLGSEGTPRPELFVEDGLHLSHAGYVLWASLVESQLAPEAQGNLSESDGKR